NWSRSKKPVRTFRSLSIGMCGTCVIFPFCQVEDALQGCQLAVDLAVREPPLFAIVTFLTVRGAPPPLARARRLRASRWPRAPAGGDHVCLPRQDEPVDVRRRDRCQATAAEMRHQVQPNPSLELVR